MTLRKFETEVGQERWSVFAGPTCTTAANGGGRR
ncbi:MAG TPA: DUF6662 family protein [Xanthomonadaceae bacterium]|nr:DUF6662 family protein [Xanthomonadaceae bacterium]